MNLQIMCSIVFALPAVLGVMVMITDKFSEASLIVGITTIVFSVIPIILTMFVFQVEEPKEKVF